MAKLQLSPLAQEDLQAVKKYITDELQNPQAAINTVTQITKKLHNLEDFPGMGTPLVSKIDIETDYRFLVCGSYMAFYRYDGEIVYVVRILYGRRDYVKILFGETSATGD
jgi:plasmid stabilization system protein ParE